MGNWVVNPSVERLVEELATRSKTRLREDARHRGVRIVLAHDAALQEIQKNIRLRGGSIDSPDIVVGMLLVEDALAMIGAPVQVIARLRRLIELAAEGCSSRSTRQKFEALLAGPKAPGRRPLIFRIWTWLRCRSAT